MKYIKYFINYVELRTKVISVLSFIVALLYYLNTYANDNGIRVLNFILFFISMLSFDMATTSINHYIAFFKEKNASNYDNNIIEHMRNLDIKMKTNLYISIFLVVFAMIIGLVLVILSNISILLIGALCFIVGISYSYGPKPLSYTPFGELFAGGFMGIVLPVLVIFSQYDHIPWELNPTLIIVFFPLAFLIGSILFANNLCDRSMDMSNNRYTLAYYLPDKKGLYALYLSNVGVVCSLSLSVVFDYLDISYLVLILIISTLNKNVRLFGLKFSKKDSFPLIVKNFIVFTVVYCFALIVFK